MAIARVSAYNRIKQLGYGDKCLFINTVHDSIIIDIDTKVCDNNRVVSILHEVFSDIPKNVEKLFGVPFNVPMEAEVQIGQKWCSRYEKIDGKIIEVDPLGMYVV